MNSSALPEAEGKAEGAASGLVRKFTVSQRIALSVISFLGWLAIRAIGPTLRVSSVFEPGSEGEPRPRPTIYCFWHRCVFAAGYLWRGHCIRVLTSRSYDGEYIARIIERLGFRAVRGSSSRGAISGLRQLQRELDGGKSVAFTIDGPRGPRYVAKPGPIPLSRNTGAPIVCFYVAAERAWVLRSWDAFLIPKPFTRVHVHVCSPVMVTEHGEQDLWLAQMQASLDRARRLAEDAAASAGGSASP